MLQTSEIKIYQFSVDCEHEQFKRKKKKKLVKKWRIVKPFYISIAMGEQRNENASDILRKYIQQCGM